MSDFKRLTRRDLMRRGAFLAAGGATFLAGSHLARAAGAPATSPAGLPVGGGGTGRKYALLAGVTEYPSLPAERWLTGPKNDVEMMRDLLKRRFGFADADIVLFKESEDPKIGKPTHDNIINQLKVLAERARPGDSVVVFLSGHGSRAPHEPKPGDTNPDATVGLFLPRDIGTWDADLHEVPNAITDYELSGRINAILNKQATVWLMMDCCHSGGMVRGVDRGGPALPGEVNRDISADALGIPAGLVEDVMAKEQMAEQSRGVGDEAAAPKLRAAIEQPGLVATYACRRIETTPERRFPVEDPQPKEGPFGLFTYTVIQTIDRAKGRLTYAELVRKVNVQYDAWNRNQRPYSFCEGKARDSFILGTGGVRASDYRLAKARDGSLTINAGRLNGLNPGSILAVYPVPGSPDDDKVIGHVRIDKADVFKSEVSPAAFDGRPSRGADVFDSEQVCQAVFVDFGLVAQKVCLEADANTPDAQRKQVEAALAHLEEKTKLIAVTASPAGAAWRVMLSGGAATLREVASGREYRNPDGTDLAKWVEESLAAAARAQGLLAVAANTGSIEDGGTSGVSLTITVKRGGQTMTFDGAGKGITLKDNDAVMMEIANDSESTVDVALLFINGDYRIEQLYPRPGVRGENRVPPGHKRRHSGTIVADAAGPERVLLVVARSDMESPEPRNFDFLESRGIEKPRGRDAMDAITALLFQSQSREAEGQRGFQSKSPAGFSMKVLGWETAK